MVGGSVEGKRANRVRGGTVNSWCQIWRGLGRWHMEHLTSWHLRGVRRMLSSR